ncbi:DUF1120 domain-containing protein [Serratia ureilytica]|uniref:DUF1120 domain-containing protein n=1 Tax=Serratia ureilytica TaxID=300181 RepID=UPI00214E2C5B|nr:DUF1120 domain-containing protein [Serratia ureilytica]UUW17350.1 DUF1120 domain-containing protein [Serratia ureilytica]
MMKHMQKTACTLAVLATTSMSTMAADSVDVRVIGTITPAACTPTLSGGGVVDYGTMNPNTLSAAAYTVLPEHDVDFAITCDAPAKVAITAINGRPNTAAGVTEGAGQNAGVAPVQLFGRSANAVGLGLDGSSKIGGYAVNVKTDTFTADSSSVSNIFVTGTPTTGTTWSASPTGEIYHSGTVARYFSWAATGTTVPAAFTTLAGKLGVQAYINHASELDLTKPVTLDGLTTIELVYL